MAIGTILAVGSALGGALGKAGGNRRGKENEGKAQDSIDAALKELGKTTDILDALKPTIDKFASQGQDAYDRYTAMAGPLEDSVNDYIGGLDPGQFAAQGNQLATQEAQKLNDGINSQLNAQGIMSPAMQAQIQMGTGNQLANTKAQNTLNAPGQVAGMQSQWLNQVQGRQDQGWNQLQQGVGAQSGLANQYNQAYNNMASIYGGQAAGYNEAAQNQYNAGNKSLSNGLMGLGYFGNKAGWFDGGGGVADAVSNSGGNTPMKTVDQPRQNLTHSDVGF